jgi:hypothetical protein
MNEGDLIVRNNNDIGIILEKSLTQGKYGYTYMVYWGKNKTFNTTPGQILSDYIVAVHRAGPESLNKSAAEPSKGCDGAAALLAPHIPED